MARLFTGLVSTGASGDQYVTAASTMSTGELIYFDSSGQADLADATAGAGFTYHARGVVVVGAVLGSTAKIRLQGIEKVLFATAPAASDNGKPVFLSASSGQATLNPPGSGHAITHIGILTGANGSTMLPEVALNFLLPVLVP
jgi:hypothetical protein